MDYPHIDRPREPGFYFYRWPKLAFWCVVAVERIEDGQLVALLHGTQEYARIETLKVEWRGPIPEPSDRPACIAAEVGEA